MVYFPRKLNSPWVGPINSDSGRLRKDMQSSSWPYLQIVVSFFNPNFQLVLLYAIFLEPFPLYLKLARDSQIYNFSPDISSQLHTLPIKLSTDWLCDSGNVI